MIKHDNYYYITYYCCRLLIIIVNSAIFMSTLSNKYYYNITQATADHNKHTAIKTVMRGSVHTYGIYPQAGQFG